eukprot:gene2862-5697_t
MNIHAFAVEMTRYPIPSSLAKKSLHNQLVSHGTIVQLPDAFLGTRSYLLALVPAESDGNENQEQIHSGRPVALTSKTLLNVKTYHKLHAHHPSLKGLKSNCLQQCNAQTFSSNLPVPFAHEIADRAYGTLFRDLKQILHYSLLQDDVSLRHDHEQIRSILVSGHGDNYEPESVLGACHALGIPIVDIHEFDQVSIGNIAHALRLAALSRPCVLWLPDLDLLFPRQIDPEQELGNELLFVRSILKRSPRGVVICSHALNPRRVHPLIGEDFDLILTSQKPQVEQRITLLEYKLSEFFSFWNIVRDVLIQATNGCSLCVVNNVGNACYCFFAKKSEAGCKNHYNSQERENLIHELSEELNIRGLTGVGARLFIGISKCDLICIGQVLQEIRGDFSYFLENEIICVPPPASIVISGPSGCGKTHLCQHLGRSLGCNILAPTLADVVKGEFGESEREISELFEQARRLSPCIIIFDDFEPVFSSSREHGGITTTCTVFIFSHSPTYYGRQIVSQLVHEMDQMIAHNLEVVAGSHTWVPPSSIREERPCVFVTIVLVAEDIHALHPLLLAATRCAKLLQVYKLNIPDRHQRELLLHHYLTRYQENNSDEDIKAVSHLISGRTHPLAISSRKIIIDERFLSTSSLYYQYSHWLLEGKKKLWTHEDILSLLDQVHRNILALRNAFRMETS